MKPAEVEVVKTPGPDKNMQPTQDTPPEVASPAKDTKTKKHEGAISPQLRRTKRKRALLKRALSKSPKYKKSKNVKDCSPARHPRGRR